MNFIKFEIVLIIAEKALLKVFHPNYLKLKDSEAYISKFGNIDIII